MTIWHRAFLSLLAVAAVAFVVLSINGLADRIGTAEEKVDDSSSVAAENAEAAQRLAAQVKRLGGEPVVDPGDLAPGSVGPAGPVGPAGEQGAVGPPGERGDRGPVGPRGPVGDVGNEGSDGQTGEAGAQGPPGPPGPQGEQGPTGEPGRDGNPPRSFTFTDPGTAAEGDETTYRCTDPDNDGDYTCDPQ